MALTKLTSNLIEGGTGTEWVSTIQTSNFTAVAGKGYFVNTTSAEITVTLPAGVVGNEVIIQDYAGTFGTNKVLLNTNGSEKIQGSALEGEIKTSNATAVLIYQDATKGWTSQDISLALPPLTVNYLVVAGGGGGGGTGQAGGGGAGGLRTNYGGTAMTLVSSTNYLVTVGAGGASSGSGTSGSGIDSVFHTITSSGGGGGGAHSVAGGSGGSGGGGGTNGSGGAGNTPSTNPSQGYAGSTPGTYAAPYSGGGGGGYTASGTGGGNVSGNGGAGIAYTSGNSITGSALSLAGGGGGGAYNGTAGTATNGGGAGAAGTGLNSGLIGTAGTPNTGGGGGGTGNYQPGFIGVNGGSGVVILRYSNLKTITNPGGGLIFATATVSTDKVTTFTAGTGNIQFN